MQRYGLQNKYKINSAILEKFLCGIETGYGRYGNPYHNMLHGADVAQTTHQLLVESKVMPNANSSLILWSLGLKVCRSVYC